MMISISIHIHEVAEISETLIYCLISTDMTAMTALTAVFCGCSLDLHFGILLNRSDMRKEQFRLAFVKREL